MLNSAASTYNCVMLIDNATMNDRFRAAFWGVVRGSDVVRLRQWEQWHVTLPQLRVLHRLLRHPNTMTGDLARALGITVSTTSGLVIKLVERGLIDRGVDSADRRQAPLRLSPEGEALLGEMRGTSVAFLEDVMARLGPDLAGVTAALETLAVAAAAAQDTDTGAAPRAFAGV